MDIHFCVFTLLDKVGPFMVITKYQVQGLFHNFMLNAVGIGSIE